MGIATFVLEIHTDDWKQPNTSQKDTITTIGLAECDPPGTVPLGSETQCNDWQYLGARTYRFRLRVIGLPSACWTRTRRIHRRGDWVQIELSWIIFVIMIAVLLEVLQQHLDEMERSGEATERSGE